MQITPKRHYKYHALADFVTAFTMLIAGLFFGLTTSILVIAAGFTVRGLIHAFMYMDGDTWT